MSPGSPAGGHFSPTESAPRAVLFDAAGTLIELAEPLGETYARIARAHGVELPAWRLQDAFRRVLRAAEPICLPGLAPEELAARERDAWRRIVHQTFRAADSAAASKLREPQACADALCDHYAAGRAWRLRPGALEGLDALRGAGFRLAVVSNFDGRLRGILGALDVAPRLDAVLLPSDLGAAKPAARAFRAALERLGVTAERAAFVGDDPERDLAAAEAAGLVAVDVRPLATLAGLRRRIEELLP